MDKMDLIYNNIERWKELVEAGMELPEGSTNSINLIIFLEVMILIAKKYDTGQK